MCTAVSYKTKDHYFGRNLDVPFSFNESVTVSPRKFPFHFKKLPALKTHYAMIGMAFVSGGFPLYYDGTNERGLSAAGLNFPGNAVYNPEASGTKNLTPFEFIPYILGSCATVAEAREALSEVNLLDADFSESLPLTPLHWIISDKNESITVEPLAGGLKIYDNPVGLLTNNPTFDFHMTNLSNYMHLSPKQPENNFAPAAPLAPFSLGMGAVGLPGDLSSVSRFVRAAFTKLNSVSNGGEGASVSQFFHILGSVFQPRGCAQTAEGEHEFTLYSSCCNTDKGIYYYKTYENSQITAVDMHRESLDSQLLISYPLLTGQQVKWQN